MYNVLKGRDSNLSVTSRDGQLRCLVQRCEPTSNVSQDQLGSHMVIPRDDDAAIVCRSREQSLQFSEADSPWQPIPRWANFLIGCGYACAGPDASSRRIGLISMPCESAAAAVVALGAMLRRLTLTQANDLTSHYQRIDRHATSAAKELVPTFLRSSKYKGRFRLDGKDKDGVIWVRSEAAASSHAFSSYQRLKKGFAILPQSACDWYFDGEGPVQALQGAEPAYAELYQALLEDGAVIKSNLRQSDSSICLAGRVAGGSVSKAIFEAVRFKQGSFSADLSELLTVQDWSPGTISRVSFFNTRTHQLDRNTGLTRLVIADGDAAFLRVLERTEFKSSDVLGVIHRTVDRERLEALGFKIAELQQWYSPELGMQGGMPPPPPGITILLLRRK